MKNEKKKIFMKKWKTMKFFYRNGMEWWLDSADEKYTEEKERRTVDFVDRSVINFRVIIFCWSSVARLIALTHALRSSMDCAWKTKDFLME